MRLRRKDGFEVCRELREHGSAVPILMLTARDGVFDRIAGLDSGADDYLTKPFDCGELLARLRAVVRRGVRPLLPERLRVGDLELDTRARRVERRGRKVPLTAREYALREHLARRSGEVVGRAETAEHVWDETYDPFSNVIEVYVRRLPRKLDDPGRGSVIRTRRGEGYELAPPRAVVGGGPQRERCAGAGDAVADGRRDDLGVGPQDRESAPRHQPYVAATRRGRAWTTSTCCPGDRELVAPRHAPRSHLRK